MFRGLRRKAMLFVVALLAAVYLQNHSLTELFGSSEASGSDNGTIPANYLAEYKAAAGTCPDLDWTLLAGVGQIETHHGRLKAPGVTSGENFAHARGPMQFLQPTFNGVRAKHSDVGPNIYNPAHAIPAAAHYLCDSGLADGDKRKALWAYNHSDEYRIDVLAAAARYASAGL